MTISPEVISVLGVGIAWMALNWRMYAELKRDINGVRSDVSDLRERMARIEGLFEGFTRREPKEVQ